MNIGYACLALGVLHSDYHTCRIDNANSETLSDLIKYNLSSLDNIIDYTSTIIFICFALVRI